ncbi:MAG: ATP-binding protein, partial [Bacteroidales bacterium]|nr:ATP-binding protein [Bacteroidales bacterium]
MANIYDKRRIWKWAFLCVSLVLVLFFLYVSNNLVDDMSQQERARMEIWAEATKQLASAPVFSADPMSDVGVDAMPQPATDIDFLLGIIEGNRNIPVLLVDANDNILQYRNFRLPEPVDSLAPFELSPTNAEFLQNKLNALRHTKNHIVINIDANTVQHLYYEDSTLLRRISYYPNIQLAVMVVFVLIVYFAVVSIKKAEQNKVWVGLSKETAHQLGTPISSLMAWVEMLEATGTDKEIVDDMDKDVRRLSKIAERFSKIGSKPEMELAFINESVTTSLDYMRARISKNVNLSINLPDEDRGVMLCPSLFEWVM